MKTSRLPLLLLMLLAAGALAASAHALPERAHSAVGAEEGFAEPEEAVEEGLAEIECEEAGLEFEEGEIGVEELEAACEPEGEAEAGDEEARETSPPCPLRSSNARVVVQLGSGRLRLTLGYTTRLPVAARIEYGPHRGTGSSKLGTARRRLGRSGVIRLSRRLGEHQLARARAAGRFTVRVELQDAPAGCAKEAAEALTVKHESKRQAVFSAAR